MDYKMIDLKELEELDKKKKDVKSNCFKRSKIWI